MKTCFQHRQDELLRRNHHVEELENKLMKRVEAFHDWYNLGTSHLSRCEIELAARKMPSFQRGPPGRLM